MRFYWQLFTTFFRIGAFTIGGGYVMIPLIQDEVVERRRWIGQSEFVDMLAMAQSVPGVLAINTAVFVGYRLRGIKGSLITVLGCALPSFMIILAVAICFSHVSDNPVVESIFKGIRPAVVALIVAPLYRMSKSVHITWKTLWIPVAAALLIWIGGISPIWVVIAAMAGGIGYHVLSAKRADRSKKTP